VPKQRQTFGGWLLVFAVFAGGLIIGRPWSLALGGIALLSFALALATNWHGLLDAMPRRTVGPFSGGHSAGAMRATFGVFAAIGALVFATGLVQLVT